MIFIDDRGGATAKVSDKHYPTQLANLISDSILTRLDAGDVAFSGVNGVMVGIELKKVSDALGCLFSSRLADTQLPEMAKVYDVRYLLIEGLYRGEPGSGVLQRWQWFKSDKDVKCGRWTDAYVNRNRMMFNSFEMWLHTMSEKGQARLEKTSDVEGTASLIIALHTWWNREEHRSMNVFDEWTGNAAALSRPEMLRRMLALLPHVAWERSKELRQRIGRVEFYRKDGRPMTVEDWFIEGQLAEKSAMDIMRSLNGEND